MRPRPRGFSLIEAVLASAIVAVLASAALTAAGKAASSRRTANDGALGSQLAHDLARWIATLPYEDTNGVPTFGVDPDDLAMGDDVDDFDGIGQSPPVDDTGEALASAEWSRTVTVSYVNPGNPTLTVGYDTGLKRIDVIVKRGGTVRGKASVLRSRAWDSFTGRGAP
ncbi:MAG TPA: prepilin-type N-terminal cleavage/methylation domain-containing protein [Phycisphaerales bacterium]|nr:prepilin-type N-terminal cleavage/methylation domain-containing protein [Phycisphaerales bacterium]